MNYRHPVNKMWYTRSLFHEEAVESRQPDCPVVFSLYNDIPGLINCRKTFVALMDPTGYKWAMRYLGDWDHWLRLVKCKWFSEALEVWIAEMKMKIRSEALEKISEISQGESTQALAAAKYLSTFDWEKTHNQRGRPSKAEMDKALRASIEALESENEDAKRIKLVS